MNICVFCEKTFALRKNLYAHMRNVHKVQPCIKSRKNLVCSSCSSLQKSYSDLRKHSADVHNLSLVKEVVDFDTKEGT